MPEVKKLPLPTWDDAYGSPYFSPADFHAGAVTMTIREVEYRALFCPGSGINNRVVLLCAGQTKLVAVNKTSAKALGLAFGKEFTLWKGKTISVRGGMVNGKPAVLCTALPNGSPRRSTSTPTAPLPSDIPQDSAATGGNGPATPASSPTASKDDAWAVVFVACGRDLDQAGKLWHQLKEKHGGNWAAMIADCQQPEAGV